MCLGLGIPLLRFRETFLLLIALALFPFDFLAAFLALLFNLESSDEGLLIQFLFTLLKPGGHLKITFRLPARITIFLFADASVKNSEKFCSSMVSKISSKEVQKAKLCLKYIYMPIFYDHF